MQFQLDQERPIYLQIAEQIKQEILSGQLKNGEKLPSVRELAKMAQANPNTIQKALSLLESEHLIQTQRTSGKFVCAQDEQLESSKKQLARERTFQYIQDMKALGFDEKSIRELFMLCINDNGTA